MHRPRERLHRALFFLLIALVNLALFALVYHFTVFAGWVSPPAPPAFQMVPAKPPPAQAVMPPAPNLTPAPLPASLQRPAPLLAPTITVHTPSSFELPETKPSTPSHLTHNGISTLPNGNGSGLGDDNGNGPGSSDQELYGAPVNSSDRVLVIMDVSYSMIQFDAGARDRVKNTFRNFKIREVTDCVGHVLPDDKSSGSGDLYLQTYSAWQADSFYDAVVIFTDFEDGDDPAATAAYIHFLEEHRLKLLIFSLEKVPYGKLGDYAQKSGGGVYNLRPDHQPLAPQEAFFTP